MQLVIEFVERNCHDQPKYLEAIVARVLESQERIEKSLQTLSSVPAASCHRVPPICCPELEDVRTGFNEVKLYGLRGAKSVSENTVVMVAAPSDGFTSACTPMNKYLPTRDQLPFSGA
eukprot:1032772-Amphidinium_carterae.1